MSNEENNVTKDYSVNRDNEVTSIQKLPKSVTRLLASDQVITSPASVVKELLENSLDASATTVEVKLENFGLDRVEVRDNGTGISGNNAPSAALWHHTSKLRSENLSAIATYGFRGVGLSSVCQSGKLAILTMCDGEKTGGLYTYKETGDVESYIVKVAPRGTTVVVTDLFTHLPVRRQFYSSVSKKRAILKDVEDILKAYAVIRNDLRLTLFHDRKLIWQKLSCPNTKKSLDQVFGAATTNQLVELKYKNDQNEDILISCFFPKKSSDIRTTSRAQSNVMLAFINKRPVQIKFINQALRAFYNAGHELTNSQGRYPCCLLDIQVATTSVDVNVKCDKSEVYFEDKEKVFAILVLLLQTFYEIEIDGFIVDAKFDLSTKNVEMPSLNHNSSLQVSPKITFENSKTQEQMDLPISEVKVNHERSSDIINKATKEVKLVGEKSNDIFNKNSKKVEIVRDESKNIINKTTEEIDIVGCNFKNVINKTAEVEMLGEEPSDIINKTTKKTEIVGDKFKNIMNETTEVEMLREEPNGVINLATGGVELVSESDWGKGHAYDKDGNIIVGTTLLCGKRSLDVICQGSKKIRSTTPISHSENESFSEKLPDGSVNAFYQMLNQSQNSSKNNYKADFTKTTISSSGNKTKPANKHQKNTLDNIRVKERIHQPKQPITCNMNTLKLFYQKDKQAELNVKNDEFQLIGKLSNNFWIGCIEKKLFIINHSRVQELFLYYKLMSTHKITNRCLPIPEVLSERQLGKTAHSILIGLVSKKQNELVSTVEDVRIVNNGFSITTTKGHDGDVIINLMGIADHLPSYSVEDLKECLCYIHADPTVNLFNCRPAKVEEYLKAQVLRINNVHNVIFSREDMEELFKNVNLWVPKSKCHTCLHDRELYSTLFDFNELNERT